MGGFDPKPFIRTHSIQLKPSCKPQNQRTHRLTIFLKAQDQKILNLIDEPVPFKQSPSAICFLQVPEEDEGWELLDSPFTANKSRIKEGCPYSMTLETLLEAMSRVEWPLNDEVHQDSNYGTLIQITVGQDEIDEIIRRDLHRTFPELPQFNFPEKRNALFNILKAYSLYDLEVGYCQGMGFVAGILLLYLPEEWSFQMFCLLMKEDQVNLRRFYVPGVFFLSFRFSKTVSRFGTFAKRVMEIGIPFRETFADPRCSFERKLCDFYALCFTMVSDVFLLPFY